MITAFSLPANRGAVYHLRDPDWHWAGWLVVALCGVHGLAKVAEEPAQGSRCCARCQRALRVAEEDG